MQTNTQIFKKISVVFPLILPLVYLLSCRTPVEPVPEPESLLLIDSTYHAMNPMNLDFDPQEQAMIDSGMADLIQAYQAIRAYPLPNEIPPAFQFNPLPYGFQLNEAGPSNSWPIPRNITKPELETDLAFMSIPELASLLRSGEISCLALTEFFLNRLKKHDPRLHCVISLTEAYAIRRAQELDAELAQGKDRGILHGIPYGAKDLFAFPGYPTTWGAAPYKDQVINDTATVLKKLENAGAILVAKTTLGALAMGDVWFADTTRNPWNLEEGSSGSSAGSASATAAGLLPFAIGTETWGSIVSPSTRCGTTGLRPTYGRVSRAGAMALSWSMDKIGPICRSAADCAIVFDAIQGVDPRDKSTLDADFSWPDSLDIRGLRVGYYKNAFEEEYDEWTSDHRSLKTLRKMGIELIPVDLDPGDIPLEALSLILEAEAAAAFDELTRSNRDSLLVRQHRFAWPNIFRTARYITAVEYIQAMRIRHDLIEFYQEIMKGFDLVVAPSFQGNQLLATNLTGHPAVVLPNGFNEEGSPVSLTFLGPLYQEDTLLAFAKAFQQATEFHKKHPPIFSKTH